MKNLVVLTGAGMSAESGLKTFRDSDGLWHGYDIYEVASPRGWIKDPGIVLEFYNMRRRDVAAANPNAAHYALAELEKEYKVIIVTQNIDDLHERAGSSHVIHLHGDIFKMRSEALTGINYPIKGDINLGDLAPDGAQLRPDIVWFDEPVPMIRHAANIMTGADIFVLIGTSLQVYPAAGLINFVPIDVPKYIIDRKIPGFMPVPNIHLIEKPATEGMEELVKLLNSKM